MSVLHSLLIATKLMLLAFKLISLTPRLLARLVHPSLDPPADVLLNLLNPPELLEEFCDCDLEEPIMDPSPWRKEPKDERAVPKAAMLRIGRSVGRQQAISATFVSTIVQKRPWDVMPMMS